MTRNQPCVRPKPAKPQLYLWQSFFIFRRHHGLVMRLFVALAFVFLCRLPAQAQFSDSVANYIRFSAAGNLNRSNSATAYLLTNEARYSRKKQNTTLNTIASWLYGEQSSNLTNNDFLATADFNLYRDSSKLYYWALANYTTSFSLKINKQLQTGLGAAYNFVNTPNAWLNLSNGILYETNRLTTNEPAGKRYRTVRNSLRVSYKFVFNKTVTLNGANFFQQALGNAGDYIIRTTNSIGIKLNKWVSFAGTLNYNQLRRTGRENLLLTYGLVTEKFF